MNYPYYYDHTTGAPSGRFSAPASREGISNPITPYGIPYGQPNAIQYEVPVQEQPSRLRRAADFLGRAALVGGLAYGLHRANRKDTTPVNDVVQGLLSGSTEPKPTRPVSDYPSGRGPGGDYLRTDPEEVGGIRTKKGEQQLAKFKKSLNIPTTEGRPQTEYPGLDEEIVSVSPEQSALSKTWAFVDNDRFFDHPDVDDPSVINDESPNVAAGQQHLGNYIDRLVDSAVEHLENTTQFPAPASSSMMRGVEISPDFEVEVTTFPGKRQQRRAEAARKAGIHDMKDKYYYDQLQLKETDSREVQQEKVKKQVELMDAMRAGSTGAVSMGNKYNELLKKPYGGHVKGRYAEEGMVDAVYPQSPYPRNESSGEVLVDPWS